MTEAEKLQLAQSTYQILCRALDKDDWHYRKDDEKLTVTCGAQGEDLPIEFNISVDAQRQIVIFLSGLPFKISEEKRMAGAIAVSCINNQLVCGGFDYDVSTGTIFFRMTNSFRDSILDAEVFASIIYTSCKTIDEYNDKLFMISKGLLSIEKFLEEEMKD